MPRKHVVKQYSEDSFYHIFNRSIDDKILFQEKADFDYFLSLLERHLSRETIHNQRKMAYESFSEVLELQAYCLLPTSYHLVMYLKSGNTSITDFMRKVTVAFTSYYNKKYQRRGPLFEGVFKASKIEDPTYLLHLTRYIHRLPDNFYEWTHSSLQYFIGDWKSAWMNPARVYALYDWGGYQSFLSDEDGHKQLHESVKHLFADAV